MLDSSNSGLTLSESVWNFQVCAREQKSLADICTCGAPIPEEAMVCSNCVLSTRWGAAYDDGMSAGATDSALPSDLMLRLPVLWRGLKIDHRIKK